MKKWKVLLGMVSLSLGLLATVGSTSNVSASSMSYDKAPNVLHHDWVTKFIRAPKGLRNAQYGYSKERLHITNKKFQFYYYDFHPNKHLYDYGKDWGATSHYWALSFEKLSSHRYIIIGSADPSSKVANAFGVVLSKNYRSLKAYSYDVKFKHDVPYLSHKNYQGHFYRSNLL